jgi:hypothetical protein
VHDIGGIPIDDGQARSSAVISWSSPEDVTPEFRAGWLLNARA